MRTLGVNGAGEVLYLAVAENGEIVDAAPHTFEAPAGLAAGERLPALRDQAEKTVKAFKVERVRVLDPETSWQTAAVSVQARFALETILALGAADAGVDCDRLSRAALRSLLGLPRKGELVKLAGEVTSRVGPHWGPRKRDLASLAALAAEKQ